MPSPDQGGFLSRVRLPACDDDDPIAPGDNPAVDFQAGPRSFPPGSRIAVLQGDPGQPAPYTVRFEFPTGYELPPHFHPTDEHVTVVKGTFLVGMGDELDASQALTLRRPVS